MFPGITAKTTSVCLPMETMFDLITTNGDDFEDFYVDATEHDKRSRMGGG